MRVCVFVCLPSNPRKHVLGALFAQQPADRPCKLGLVNICSRQYLPIKNVPDSVFVTFFLKKKVVLFLDDFLKIWFRCLDASAGRWANSNCCLDIQDSCYLFILKKRHVLIHKQHIALFQNGCLVFRRRSSRRNG